MGKKRRRFVGKGIPKGGYKIWDSKIKRWWGETYKYYPDELIKELNGDKKPTQLIAITKKIQKSNGIIP